MSKAKQYTCKSTARFKYVWTNTEFCIFTYVVYPHRHINLRLQPQTKLNFACAPAYITNLPLVQITNEWMNALHVGNISTGGDYLTVEVNAKNLLQKITFQVL